VTGDGASDDDEESEDERVIDVEDSFEVEDIDRLGDRTMSTRGVGGGGEVLFLWTGEPTGTRLAGPEIFFVSFFSGVLTGSVM